MIINKLGVKKMEDFIQNYFKYFIIIAIGGLVSKFMSKDRNEEQTMSSDVVIFEIKKNAKIILYIACFVFIVVIPAASISEMTKEGSVGLFTLIINLIFIVLCVYLLLAMKNEKIISKNGIFRKKNIFGKTKIYNFNDVIRAKYKANNNDGIVILYFKNKRKLEINSYQTNFDWVLKEIKIRNIEIYNK